MTAWPSVFGSTTLVTATLVTTAETVVAQVPVTEDVASAAFVLGLATVTQGTLGTDMTARLRLDSLTGTIIGNSGAVNLVAAADGLVVVIGSTPAQEFAARLIVLTLQATAATANSTVLMAGILAFTQA